MQNMVADVLAKPMLGKESPPIGMQYNTVIMGPLLAANWSQILESPGANGPAHLLQA